ncbi:DUF459 domain-containing protein [Brucellaceae bacterium C25G]
MVAPHKADAQPKTLFDMLFGEKKATPAPPPPVQKRTPRPRQNIQPKAIPATPRKPSSIQIPIPVPAPKQLLQKLEDANNVVVMGDFISSGLADGLIEAFSNNPSVRISDLSNGSSGFVRQDYYHWNQEIAGLLRQEKPSVVVMMIGANDRQSLARNDKVHSFLSDGWKQDYQGRIEQFVKTIRTAGYPIIWVGQPPYASRAMSQDMVALNEIYRSVAEQNDTPFVDVWNGFATDEGQALITGPDMNGQDAKLRSADGIGLTTAGKRKLAFYVEKPLREILTDSEQISEPNVSDSNASDHKELKRVERIPVVSLRDYGADQSGILLGASPRLQQAEKARDSSPYSPYPDRADYFIRHQ